ncbi:hypothetical protein NDN08_006605 [Rhodosorus marinus]|uniref:UBA domain-containing protein n=1 Tax=Rhodosorus marinus TaxID=101924 RepID=A0AAV8UM16_9RHOD|nr:hypothetical protein NDN08_006605 [Rhodosorus marinus]
MFESLISDVLERVLGQYVEGITRDKVSVGVWQGALKLRALKLKPEALSVLILSSLGKDSPFEVKDGLVDSVTVEVPWKAIRSQPVKIELVGLTAHVVLNTGVDANQIHERAKKVKEIRLMTDDAYRAVAKSSETVSSTQQASTWSSWLGVDDLTSSVLQNIQVEMKHVNLNLQHSDSIFSLGLRSIKILSTDSSWEEKFLSETGLPFSYKLTSISDLSISYRKQTETSSERPDDIEDVLEPLTFDTKLTVLRGGAESRDVPAVFMQIALPEVVISLSREEYGALLGITSDLALFNKKLRAGEKSAGRAYWSAVLEKISAGFMKRHRERHALQPDVLRERLDKLKSYIEARKEYVIAEMKEAKPSTQVLATLKNLELDLSTDDVLLFRDIASTDLERKSSVPAGGGSKDDVNIRVHFRLLGGHFAIRERTGPSHVEQSISVIAFRDLSLTFDSFDNSRFDLALYLQHFEMRGGNKMGLLVRRRTPQKEGSVFLLHERDNWGSSVSEELRRIREQRMLKLEEDIGAILMLRLSKNEKELSLVLELAGLDVGVDGIGGALVSSVKFWKPPRGTKSGLLLEQLGETTLASLEYFRVQVNESLFVKRTTLMFDVHVQAPKFILMSSADEEPTASSSSLEIDLGMLEVKSTCFGSNRSRHELSMTRMSVSVAGQETESEAILPPTSFIVYITLPASGEEVILLEGKIPLMHLSMSRPAYKSMLRLSRSWSPENASLDAFSASSFSTTSSTKPSELPPDETKEAQAVEKVSLKASFLLEAAKVELLETNGQPAILLVSDGLSIHLRKGPSELSGDFVMKRISCTGGQDMIFSGGALSSDDTGTDEGDEEYFFRAETSFDPVMKHYRVLLRAESLRILLIPRVISGVVEFLKPDDLSGTDVADNRLSLPAEAMRKIPSAISGAQPVFQEFSSSISVDYNFRNFEIVGALFDDTPFAEVRSTEFMARSTLSKEKEADFRASVQTFHLRDLLANQESLREIVSYAHRDSEEGSDLLSVTYDKQAKKTLARFFMPRPRLVLLGSFWKQLKSFPSSLVSTPEATTEQENEVETEDDVDVELQPVPFEFEVVFEEVYAVLPRTSRCATEGLRLLYEKISITNAKDVDDSRTVEVVKMSVRGVHGDVFFLERPGQEPSHAKFLRMENENITTVASTWIESDEIEGKEYGYQVVSDISESVKVSFSEAQYTVFVLSVLDNAAEVYHRSADVDTTSKMRAGSSTPMSVLLRVSNLELALFKGVSPSQKNSLMSFIATNFNLRSFTSSSGKYNTYVTALNCRIQDLRKDHFAAEKFIVDRRPRLGGHLGGADSEEQMLDLYYSNMQKGTPTFRATLACSRMLLVPPLMKELGKLTAVGDVYLETSEDPRVYDFEGIGLDIKFRGASLGVCSCRNATDRDALLVSGDFDFEAILNADKGIDDASIKLQVDSIEASYNVLSSDTSVRLVSPFSTQLTLRSSHLKATVSGLRCCLDVRDMPVVAGCLNRLSEFSSDSEETETGNQSSKVDPRALVTASEFSFADSRLLVTEMMSHGACIPCVEIRNENCVVVNSKAQQSSKLSADVRARIYERDSSRWVPVLEPWVLECEFRSFQSEKRVYLSSPMLMNLNISPGVIGTATAVKRAYQSANEIIMSSPMIGDDLNAWLRRPSIAAFVLRNKSGMPLEASLVLFGSTKKRLWSAPLDGVCEVEVHLPFDDDLSEEVASSEGSHGRMRWEFSSPNYSTVNVPLQEGAKHPFALYPIDRSAREQMGDVADQALLLWEVSSKNGVPVATLKSDLTFTNNFAIPMDVKVGDEDQGEVLFIEPEHSISIPCLRTNQPVYVRPSRTELVRMREYDWSVAISKAHFTRSEGQRLLKEFSLLLTEAAYHGDRMYVQVKAEIPATDCVNITLRPTLVLESRLPRSFLYAFIHEKDGMLTSGTIAPTESVNLYGLRSDLRSVRLSVTYDNSASGFQDATYSLSIGSGTDPNALLSTSLEHFDGVKLVVYARLYIENRSDMNFFLQEGFTFSPLPAHSFDEREPTVIIVNAKRPTLAVGRPVPENFWTLPMNAEDMTKPCEIPASPLSLLVHSRPSQLYDKSVELVIMNSMWMDNRSGFRLEYSGSLPDTSGIVETGRVVPLRLGKSRKNVRVRLRPCDGSWGWSYPVPFNPIGELPMLFRQMEFPDVYIARLQISKTTWGARVLIVKPEDLEHPPFVVHNACESKYIVSFRQRGTHVSTDCRLRSGEFIRYAWDIPDNKEYRTLLLNVADFSDTDGASIELNIQKPQTRVLTSRNDQQFIVSVFSKDATMLVQVSQAQASETEYRRDLHLNSRESSAIPVVDWDETFSRRSSIGADPGDNLGPISVPRITRPETLDDAPISKLENTLCDLLKRTDIDSPSNSPILPASMPTVVSDGLGGHELARTSSSEESPNLSVRVSIFSVGISIISGEPQELLYITLVKAQAHYALLQRREIMALSVANAQIDTQLSSKKWPVLLHFPPNVAQSSTPVVQLSSIRNFASQTDILRFRGLFLSIQKFKLFADEHIALKLVRVLEEYSSQISDVRSRASLEWELIHSANVTRVQIDKLLINPLDVTLSFSTSRAVPVKTSLRYRLLLRPIVSVFGNVENNKLKFESIDLEGVFDTTSHLNTLLVKYYANSFAKQRLRFASSSKLLGDPAGLFETVSAETNHVFFSPAEGSKSEDFLVKVGEVSGGFAAGFLGSVKGFTSAVSEGVSELTDDEFYRQRELILRGNNEIVLPSTGFYRGAMNLGHGIQSGLTDLVAEPWQGAMEGGVGGFAEGLSRGVTSAITKPLVGGMDMIALPVAGYMNLITVPGHIGPDPKVIAPVRPRRLFASNGNLQPYNWRKSIGQALFEYVSSDATLKSNGYLVGWTELSDDVARADTNYLANLWGVFSGFLYKGTNPLQSTGMKGLWYKKRLAIVLSDALLFLTFTGDRLWTSPLTDIESVQTSDYDQRKVLIRVPSNPSLSAEVNCVSNEARENLLLYLSMADRRFAAGGINPSPGALEADEDSVGSWEDMAVSPTYPDLSMQIVIVNETSKTFSLAKDMLSEGEWTVEPPTTVKSWDACTFEARNVSKDIRGMLEFGSDGDKGSLVLRFSNKFPHPCESSLEAPSDIVHSFDQVDSEQSLMTIMLTERSCEDRSAEVVEQLQSMGFDQDVAQDALARANGDIGAAVEILTALNVAET